MQRRVLVALGGTGLLGLSRAETLPWRQAWLERNVPGLMRRFEVPGVSLCLLQEGRTVWQRQWGTRQFAEDQPVSAETVFEAASMSKPVFALLLMQQVQTGRLDLDRPVLEVLAERRAKIFFSDRSPPTAQQLRWRQRITPGLLLAHRSGLPNWRQHSDAGPVLGFEPGSGFRYSGEGYVLLQALLEQVCGQDLQAQAAQALFEPLGMRASGFVLSETLARQRARGHTEHALALPWDRYLQANAAYTLYTTPQDYARFLSLMMTPADTPPSLQAASLRQMLSPQVAVAAAEQPLIRRPGKAAGQAGFWSLGFALNPTAQGVIAHHSGSNSTGYRAFCQFSPSRRSGLVFMSNGLNGREIWTRLVAAIGDL